MAKYNIKGSAPKARVQSPVTTSGQRTPTFEGATGFGRTAMSDLYLLSVSNMVQADTFYEKADPRDERYIDLLHEVALNHPEFEITKMLPWLRTSGFMRTASVLGAAEVAKALCDASKYDGVEDMIDGSLQRADELGEFLAYWFSIAGKQTPYRYQAVYRGLKRAAQRLITEYAYGKYDSAKRAIRFADIIQIVHPKPVAPWQSDLFKLILNQRYGSNRSSLKNLPMIEAAGNWHGDAEIFRRGKKPGATVTVSERDLLDLALIKVAGLTWEDVMSGLGAHVEKAKIWEAVIPNMGIGALLKNLRNFDEAGISRRMIDYVTGVISDPERVAKGRVFPYRFLAAHRAVPSLRWASALEEGLKASLENVPVLKGSTLILVDRSPSMFPGMMGSTPSRSDITLADQAAVFGAALATKAQDPTLVEFGGAVNGMAGGAGSRIVQVRKGASVLKLVDSFGDPISGTDIPRAVKDNFRRHDRIVIVTDEQSRPGWLPSNMSRYGGMHETEINDLIPKSTPVYLWNMVGYSSSILNSGGATRHCFGGLSDTSFSLISLLEQGKNAKWPWLS